MINRKNKIVVVLKILAAMFVLVGIVTCTMNELAKESARNVKREANGGIIPGKEALVLGSGRAVEVITILHEGKKYTCFLRGYKQMGCVKEFPYD